ncbi:hypothetical protein [Streptomyces aidingensis]|uniref:DUF8094 domain-containing protein n=1 Tax=Streptomyces aidingensis TaxID=910347 RepID=A0A1I1L625_9ACTN|nr:hypothetical protein [Streptomyces aidingensis]SFC68405.1 hypothetical protein SAMN05421773_10566 [Streptomyces aidingensis]
MLVRARSKAASIALAVSLALPLAGCMTVHGERAEVPAVTETEAQAVLEHYAEVSNEANLVYDEELNRTVDTGALGQINRAGHRARHEVHPEGNPDYRPLAFEDTRFHIPRLAGWPKFFLADTLSGRGDGNRWLLVFTRGSLEEDWKASYLSLLPPSAVPEFAQDEDGHAVAVRTAGGPSPDPAAAAADGLALDPAGISAAYGDYLRTGEGPFADGPYTSEELARREGESTDPAFYVQHEDLPPEDPALAALGLRTTDGGALLFFTVHHHEQKTWATGVTPVVDEYVEALMEGEPEQTVTIDRMAILTAHVPAEGDGEAALLFRISGALSATGA